VPTCEEFHNQRDSSRTFCMGFPSQTQGKQASGVDGFCSAAAGFCRRVRSQLGKKVHCVGLFVGHGMSVDEGRPNFCTCANIRRDSVRGPVAGSGPFQLLTVTLAVSFAMIPIRALMNADCPFCRMVAGQERASCVWDDPCVFGIMSLEQPTPYKVLIIPKTHVETIFDLSDELASEIFKVTVRVSRAVREASGCAGLNIIQSNGSAGQQDVFHFHLHIVPRFPKDNIVLRWENRVEERFRLDKLAGEIKTRIRAL